MIVYPLLGKALGLTDLLFGVWAGTAIHDTSSVVAGGYAFSDAAGQYATVVKLTRTTLLIPVALFFAVASTWAASGERGGSTSVAKFLILMAMLGVGLGADLRKLSAVGVRPLLLGLVASVLIAVLSISLAYLLLA